MAVWGKGGDHKNSRNNSLTLMFNPKYGVPSFVTPSLLQGKQSELVSGGSRGGG